MDLILVVDISYLLWASEENFIQRGNSPITKSLQCCATYNPLLSDPVQLNRVSPKQGLLSWAAIGPGWAARVVIGGAGDSGGDRKDTMVFTSEQEGRGRLMKFPNYIMGHGLS